MYGLKNTWSGFLAVDDEIGWYLLENRFFNCWSVHLNGGWVGWSSHHVNQEWALRHGFVGKGDFSEERRRCFRNEFYFEGSVLVIVLLEWLGGAIFIHQQNGWLTWVWFKVIDVDYFLLINIFIKQ